jgi:hypothetical protein
MTNERKTWDQVRPDIKERKEALEREAQDLQAAIDYLKAGPEYVKFAIATLKPRLLSVNVELNLIGLPMVIEEVPAFSVQGPTYPGTANVAMQLGSVTAIEAAPHPGVTKGMRMARLVAGTLSEADQVDQRRRWREGR